MGIFKAYDIRGIYPEELSEETAYKIGRAFVSFLNCKKAVVGYDARESGKKLFDALTKGIIDQGADVVNIKDITTPMLFFAINKIENADSGIMITASHNPAEYNGFKLCREKAIPLNENTGIKEIEKMVEKNDFKEPDKKGGYSEYDIGGEYEEFYNEFTKKIGLEKNNLNIIIDCGNGMGYKELPVIKKFANVETIYENPDGSFPNHSPDTTNKENLKEIKEKIKNGNFDLGIVFDGDCDRAVFMDEKGNNIEPDIITALISEFILKDSKEKNEKIIYDIRSSLVVEETIRKNKGIPLIHPVGASLIKTTMRKENAVFCGEKSGHYMFRNYFYSDSALMTIFYVFKIMQKQEKSISEIIKPYKKYYSSYMNFEVSDKDKTIKKVEDEFTDYSKKMDIDGVSVYYDNYWFNIRKSNTEPVVRLTIEAKSKEILENIKKRLNDIINEK
ncbi:phosphomannomutase/phosphoglucomutase [Candidatus Woesearchaeota archaeon]|nr:phosphomannomutase/phosphoglucomutase [Candidatus Woesearchaeota archaeon]